MGKRTKWTPELVAQELERAHRRWLEDDIHGRRVGKPFNPAYLVRIKRRQAYDQNRNNGVFAAGLARAGDAVRAAWTARPHTDWTEKKVAGRLQELFKRWWTEVHLKDAGRPWSLSYLTQADKTFVRVTQRLGFSIETIIKKRLGGDIRTYWRPTRQLTRRARQKRTLPDAAKALTDLYRRWSTDADRGLPAGRAFGPHYLTVCGEQRLEAWIRRGKARDRIRQVLRYAPPEVAKAWFCKRRP